MKSYRSNLNRRQRYRNSDRKRNNGSSKINHDISSTISFPRRPVQNSNHNVSKLIEKYTILAKEALSSGDKIMSENYFQHADHFSRVQSVRQEQNNNLKDNLNPSNQDTNNK